MTSDLDIARRMLQERSQCSTDYEADDSFAEATGLLDGDIKNEQRAHRRRVKALGALVKLGEADSWWIGVPLDASWHGSRRAVMYRLKETS